VGIVLCGLALPLLLCGCLGIPSNAVKLSSLQMEHLEQYNTAVQSLIDSHRADAEALIAERNRTYDQILQRCEGFHKELYRLASHLLSRRPIPAQAQRFQESLDESDRAVIRRLEEHVNRRIARYEAASVLLRIDPEAFCKARQENKTEEIRKVLDQIPSRWSSLRRDIENFLMHEPFEEVRPLVVKRIEEINAKGRTESPDIDRLGEDVRVLTGKVGELETAIDSIRGAQARYRQKAAQAMAELDLRVKDLESAGQTVLATQQSLHGALHRVKTVQISSGDILSGVHPLVESLGTAGVMKEEEMNAVTQIVDSIKDLVKSEET